jgi:cytochrome c oxidase subunit 2
MHTGIDSPQGIWWMPAHGAERLWVAVAFAWCIVLFAMMPLWHLRGQQNPSGIRHKVEPTRYYQRVQEFINQYKVGEEAGIPIVAPPPGSHVYLLAQMWKWTPILKLQKGVEYTCTCPRST